jgi:hypothetical protein
VSLPLLIPGAVTKDSARLLALIPAGAAAPVLEVTPPAGGARPIVVPGLPPSLVPALAARGVAAHPIELLGLQPDTSYAVKLPGTAAAVLTRTLPTALPPEGLSVAVASCYYDFFNGHEKYRRALMKASPFPPHRFKLLVGDNLYLDVEPDKAAALDALGDTLRLYLRYYVESNYTNVLGLSPNFTTWDDHEYWNNYPEQQLFLRRTLGERDRGFYGAAATQCLRLFQESINPPRRFAGAGRSYAFEVGALSFFMADGRTNRQPYQDERTAMLTADDLQALKLWAAGLTGPGVLVLGQPLLIEPGDKDDYTPPNYGVQYRAIWSAVLHAPWDILIVSGDVHFSRLLSFDVPALPGLPARTLYEVVTSPASHIPTVGSIIWDTLGFGRSKKQGHAEVSYPERVATGHPLVREVRPRYLVGTDAPESIGALNFVPLPSGAVRVGCAFHDLDGDLARATPALGGRVQPVDARCLLPSTIQLARRR